MSTRERLLDATERIIRDRGIAAVTTKDIAREAGFAEATLYRHFQDKTDLLLCVFGERLPGHFLALIRDLPARAGEGTVAANLEQLAAAAAAFFAQTAPLSVAVAADPALAARHYARLRDLGVGPEAAHQALAAYLRAEQGRGRVRAEVDPDAATTLLLGVCFNDAYARHVAGAHATMLPAERFATEIVRTLLIGLAPPA
ncbi:MAG TPA: TetR/AcrR family transcriptional regulator [Thermomicrobiales bacterium]|nr:TetR/AcrR family transcriptional regulator [Thermomicrobiales bacterium]